MRCICNINTLISVFPPNNVSISSISEVEGRESGFRADSSAQSAFSLVETVIAVAIVATVMVALLAMLPIGLDSLLEAKKTDIQARIMQSIISEVQMTGWKLDETFEADLRDKFPTQVRFFDDEGNEVSGSSHPNRIYTARVRMDKKGPELPGDGTHIQGGAVNPFLRTIIIEITSLPQANSGFFDDPGNANRIKVMTSTVVSTEPIEEGSSS